MGKKNNKNKRSLDNLSEAERAELFSRGAKLRKAAFNAKSSKKWKQTLKNGEWEDIPNQEKRVGKDPSSLEVWAEKALSKAAEMGIFDQEKLRSETLHEGLIITISRQGGELLF